VIPLKDNIPTDRFPLVTVGLILANVIVYLLAIRHGGSIISGPDTYEVVKYGSIPYELTHCLTHRELIQGSQIACTRASGMPVWQTAFTAMFMHASILHIGGNMLFLWIFGNNVEDSMGRVKFLLFYIVGGLAALALQVAIDPSSTAPTLGASGAIAAALGGYIVLYPRARVLTLLLIIFFFTVFELPAIVVLGLWFAQQAAFAATGLITPTGSSGGVAYYAHIGGFIFGLLTIRLLARKRKTVPRARLVF
jgi:membrane associated rhomboid family serine protease